MEDLQTVAALADQRFRVSIETLVNFTVEVEQEYETADGKTMTVRSEMVNPAWRADIRTSQRERNLRTKLGITGRDVAQAKQQREQRKQLATAINVSRGEREQGQCQDPAPNHGGTDTGTEAEPETVDADSDEDDHTDQADDRDHGSPRPADCTGVRSF